MVSIAAVAIVDSRKLRSYGKWRPPIPSGMWEWPANTMQRSKSDGDKLQHVGTVASQLSSRVH